MKVGFVGLGKLGLPCAVAMDMKGHDVMGYDVVANLMNKNPRPYLETGPDGQEPFNPYLAASKIRFGSMKEVVDHAHIIFVAVQTPHLPEYEGDKPMPETRADFDYSYLMNAVRRVTELVERDTAVVVISTVLPGTFRKYLKTIIESNPHVKLCYNPYFIAMGTTMRDFLNPEFVLFGVHDVWAATVAEQLYKTICPQAPFYRTAVENAELIKVAYNTYISQKIVFSNTLMEICHRIPGCDVDAVTTCLKMAKGRLISPAYMDGGMGDGGGCHPRDGIALSWLARELGLSYDLFGSVMVARECHTEFLADLMCQYDLPKAILGFAFKAKTNIVTGSAAVLLRHVLEARGVSVVMDDPYVLPRNMIVGPHVNLIGVNHPDFKRYRFPKGSVVIDPWRYLELNQEGVTYVPVGVGK